MIRKTLSSIAALLLAAVLFSAVYGNEPKYGGTVVVAVTADPGGLNPAVTTQGGVHLICGSIFSGLVAQDFDLNPVPDLAERWEVSPDGRVFTFYLPPNAEFHDGVPVTSADVKFTFEEMLLKYHSRTRAFGGAMRKVNLSRNIWRFQFIQLAALET